MTGSAHPIEADFQIYHRVKIIGVERFPIAHLNVQDVPVVIVFPQSSFDSKAAKERQQVYTALRNCAARAGLAGEVVLVWRDRNGTTKFIAPPQQHPFFQIVRYDQLYAQVNGTIVC